MKQTYLLMNMEGIQTLEIHYGIQVDSIFQEGLNISKTGYLRAQVCETGVGVMGWEGPGRDRERWNRDTDTHPGELAWA